MPYIIKTSFFFAGIEQGWQEVFWWQQDSSDLTLASAAIIDVVNTRAALLSKSYVLTEARNAVIQNPGGGKMRRVSDLLEPRKSGVASWEDGEPNLALLTEWQTPSTEKSKLMYLGGIPSALGANGKTPTGLPATWNTRFQSWVTAHQQLGSGWMTSHTAQRATVTDWVLNPTTGQVTLTLGGGGINWPVSQGQAIRVDLSIPGRSPLDGSQVVVVNSNTSVYTANPVGVAPHQTTQVGEIRLKGFDFVSVKPTPPEQRFGVINGRRICTHKRGRPTYASRGRVTGRPRW